MLFEIIAGAAAVAYVFNKDFRSGVNKGVGGFMDVGMNGANQAYKKGDISDEEYNKMRASYDKFNASNHREGKY